MNRSRSRQQDSNQEREKTMPLPEAEGGGTDSGSYIANAMTTNNHKIPSPSPGISSRHTANETGTSIAMHMEDTFPQSSIENRGFLTRGPVGGDETDFEFVAHGPQHPTNSGTDNFAREDIFNANTWNYHAQEMQPVNQSGTNRPIMFPSVRKKNGADDFRSTSLDEGIDPTLTSYLINSEIPNQTNHEQLGEGFEFPSMMNGSRAGRQQGHSPKHSTNGPVSESRMLDGLAFDDDPQNDSIAESFHAPQHVAVENEVPLPRNSRSGVGSLKMRLYTAGARAHRGNGAEKKFGTYWNAVSCHFGLMVGGGLGGGALEETREAMESFLITKKMRRLHNSLVLGLMDRSWDVHAVSRGLRPLIPVPLRKRVRVLPPQDSSKIMNDSLGEVSNADIGATSDIWTGIRTGEILTTMDAVGKDPFELSTQGISRLNETPTTLPGALSVDPFVRSLVHRKGLKVTENAVWLLIVGIREYVKSLLENTISGIEAIQGRSELPETRLVTTVNFVERDSAASQQNQQPIAPTPTEPIDISRKRRCISAIDVATFLGSSPLSQGRSASRLSLDRCFLGSFSDIQTLYQDPLESACGYISSGIDAYQSKRQRVKENPSFTPPEVKISKSRNATKAPSVPPAPQNEPNAKQAQESKEKEEKKPAESSRSKAKDSSGAPSSNNTSRNRRSPALRLGRGAKNLAALKARAASSSSTQAAPSSADNKGGEQEQMKNEVDMEIIENKPEVAQPQESNADAQASTKPEPVTEETRTDPTNSSRPDHAPAEEKKPSAEPDTQDDQASQIERDEKPKEGVGTQQVQPNSQDVVVNNEDKVSNTPPASVSPTRAQEPFTENTERRPMQVAMHRRVGRGFGRKNLAAMRARTQPAREPTSSEPDPSASQPGTNALARSESSVSLGQLTAPNQPTSRDAAQTQSDQVAPKDKPRAGGGKQLSLLSRESHAGNKTTGDVTKKTPDSQILANRNDTKSGDVALFPKPISATGNDETPG